MLLMLIGFRTGFWLGLGCNKNDLSTQRRILRRMRKAFVKGANEVYAERLINEVHARSGDVQYIVLAISLICKVSGDV